MPLRIGVGRHRAPRTAGPVRDDPSSPSAYRRGGVPDAAVHDDADSSSNGASRIDDRPGDGRAARSRGQHGRRSEGPVLGDFTACYGERRKDVWKAMEFKSEPSPKMFFRAPRSKQCHSTAG